MVILCAIQVIIDVLVFVALVLWWFERCRRLKSLTAEDRLREALSQWEIQVTEFKKELAEYREKVQSQVEALAKLGDEARTILVKGRHRVTAFPPSQEEEELRTLVCAKVESQVSPGVSSQQKIPTVKEIEQTRERLKSDIILDLKSLLKEQLA